MHNKNILIFSSDLLAGGISQMIAMHVMAFLNLNYNVSVLLPKKSAAISSINSILKEQDKKKVKLKIIEYNKFQYDFSKIFNSNFFIKQFKLIDFCFVHNARLIKFSKKYTDKPVIAINHTGKLSQIKYYKDADQILTVNKNISHQLIKSGINADKCMVCPNAIINLPAIPKSSIKTNNKVIVIGAIGRLVKKKGFEEFIESIKILRERNIKLKALIAGDGELYNYLKNKASKTPEIEFVGWINNKSYFYNKLDIFCQPSYFEPFGLTIIEAMSYGLPVISTACDGPLEIINSPKNGFIVPINNSLQMADNIEKLIKNKNKRFEVGANARTHIEKNYMIENLQSSLFKCIKINS
tara:strand:+ start:949 stop:2010 length:1062 start_codon:yes stop_codon:yes gene_type:complete